jgi:hypothetical protein
VYRQFGSGIVKFEVRLAWVCECGNRFEADINKPMTLLAGCTACGLEHDIVVPEPRMRRMRPGERDA